MNRILKFLTGPRRYSILVISLLAAVLLLGIISQSLINKKREGWHELIQKMQAEMTSVTRERFTSIQKSLLKKHELTVSDFSKAMMNDSTEPTGYYELSKDEPFDGYCSEILKNGRIINWSGDIPISSENLHALSGKPNELFFFEASLKTYLIVYSNSVIRSDSFIVISGFQMENRGLHSSRKSHNCFLTDLEDLFSTEIIIDYSPLQPGTSDGRYFSVELQNNFNRKIGLATIKKNSQTGELTDFSKNLSNIQGSLVVLAFILMGFAVSGDFKKLRIVWLKPVLFVIYFCVLRLLLFKLGIPANLLTGELVEPAGFASQLGGGIVKSPVEFLLTAVLFFVCCSYLYTFFCNNAPINTGSRKKSAQIYYIALPIYIFLTLWAFRGLAASVKSVIVDSTFRYFIDPVIIPSVPQLTMVAGTLILTTGSVLILAILFRLRLPFSGLYNNRGLQKLLLFETALFIPAGILFVIIQSEPLIPLSVLLLFLVFLHILYYLIYYRAQSRLHAILAAGVFSSMLSVALLNYFNTQLEKESLKTAVNEINRPGAEFIRFLTEEVLLKGESNPSLLRALYQNKTSYDAEAYLIWNESALHEERVQASVYIIDRGGNTLGKFVTDPLEVESPVPAGFQFPAESMTVVDATTPNSDDRLRMFGFTPITDNNVVLGYLTAYVTYQPSFLVESTIPDFLRSSPQLINNVLSPADLNIFTVRGSESKTLCGDFYPSIRQIDSLFDGTKNQDNELWTQFTFNNENYVVYAQQNTPNVITGVALKDKKLDWSFFNFFKLFTVQIFVLFLIAAIASIAGFMRSRTIFITFRTQLLSAFLFVSILPVVALAVYNRYSTNEKTVLAIKSSLQAQVNSIEKQLTSGAINMTNPRAAVESLSRQTGTAFALYDSDSLIAAAGYNLYSAGILPARLRSNADYNINAAGLKEFFSSHWHGDREYYSFYKKIHFSSGYYIIEANNLLNKIPGIYSPVDVDVFLFGSYSLAIILIIGISSLIADRISLPIKQLTLATRSVAHGDLSIKLGSKAYGEIGELMNGFDTMTDELQRNQAELANLEREAAWKEFARQVAHEIKNPLTPMKLTMQQLVAAYKDQSPHFDNIFSKVASTILHQIETLNTIASEFSHFARMPVMNIENIDLIPIVHETVILFQNEKVHISLADNAPQSVIVKGDLSHFRRLFINFIRNSIQAGALNININLSVNESAAAIRISDDGSGIPSGYEGKIFETNFTTKSGGMGLGLKLSKRFIESLGGAISVEPGREKGACFIISLPL